MNNINYKKYLKYKKKYFNLKAGSALSENFYYDEISHNTNLLVTTTGFNQIEWKEYENFKNLVETFGVPIITVSGVEWGQDLIKFIKHESGLNTINYFLKIGVMEEFIKKSITDKINEYIPKISHDFEITTKSGNLYNLQKGGNFIILPQTVNGNYFYDGNRYDPNIRNKIMLTLNPTRYGIYDFENLNILALQVYLPDYEVDKFYGDDVHHIDEILTLIPYGPGINDYNIWFYNPICEENKTYEIKLREIQKFNLLILLGFFPKEKIELFDLFFDENGKIIKPPIFNRVILRKGNHFRIIFPDPKDEFIIEKVKEELDDNPYVEYFFVDTSELHNLNGNIHCGFKSIPELIN